MKELMRGIRLLLIGASTGILICGWYQNMIVMISIGFALSLTAVGMAIIERIVGE
jgi:hypothetical protein